MFFRRKNQENQKKDISANEIHLTPTNKLIHYDSRLLELIRQLMDINKDSYIIDELKKINNLTIEFDELTGKYTTYQKMCYYGGCPFSPKSFDSEYEATKHAAALTISNRIQSLTHKLSGATTKIIDVDCNCNKLYECRGF